MTSEESGRRGGGLRHVLDRSSATVRFVRTIVASRVSSGDRAWRDRRSAYYRRLWQHAAGEVGVGVRELPGTELELHRDDRSVRVKETYCSIETRAALERAGDKVLVSRLLGEAGLPTPPHVVVTLGSVDDALPFLLAAPGPCVVKPAENTGGGQGVTTRVRTPRDLHRAAVSAAAAGARAGQVGRGGGILARIRAKLGAVDVVPLLVEHQMPGSNYRLLYLDGELIDAIRRDAPSVTGDGRHTVGELIEAANSARLHATGGRGERLVTRDLDLEQTLAAQGLRWSAVPAEGRDVELKTTINENSPVGNQPARDELCAEVVEEGRRAAEAVGVRLAGVDLLTADPSVPLAESGGCVLEVNTTPGLAMHYHGNPGEVPVATVLVRRLFDRAPHTVGP